MLNTLKKLISSGSIRENNIITNLDNNTQIIFRRDFDEYAHPISSHGYQAPVNHYNIEIQTKNMRGKWVKRESYHIITNNDGSIKDLF